MAIQMKGPSYAREGASDSKKAMVRMVRVVNLPMVVIEDNVIMLDVLQKFYLLPNLHVKIMCE